MPDRRNSASTEPPPRIPAYLREDPAAFNTWFKSHILIAEVFWRAAKRRSLGRGKRAAAEGFSGIDVLSETFLMVLESPTPDYIWDCSQDFNSFFKKCLGMTSDKLIDKEWKHHRKREIGRNPRDNEPLYDLEAKRTILKSLEDPAQEEALLREQQSAALKRATSNLRMSDKQAGFMHHLPYISAAGFNTEDIAKVYVVSPKTVPSLRKRALKHASRLLTLSRGKSGKTSNDKN